MKCRIRRSSALTSKDATSQLRWRRLVPPPPQGGGGGGGTDSKKRRNRRKNEYLKWRKIDFLHSINSELLKRIKECSIHYRQLLKVHTSPSVAAIVISRPGRQKSQAKPLAIKVYLVKVKLSHYRPGWALRAPAGCGYNNFNTLCTWRR